MSRYVRITRGDNTKDVPVQDSSKPGFNHFIPKGSDGFHFKSKKSLVDFFRRKYPKADDIEVKP